MSTATLDRPYITTRVSTLLANPNTINELTEINVSDTITQPVEDDFLASMVFKDLKKLWTSGRVNRVLCEEWYDSFDTFVDDIIKKIGYRTNADQFLIRIDSSVPFSIDNVKWGSASERTRRLNRILRLTIKGINLPLVTWMELAGVKRTPTNIALFSRRFHQGLSPKDIFSVKVVSNRTSATRYLDVNADFTAWINDKGPKPANVKNATLVPLEDGLVPLSQAKP